MTKGAVKRDEKAELRGYILDLAQSIAESQELHRADGKEPSLEKLTAAAEVLCKIYALLDKTDDPEDATGSALKGYKQQFDAGKRGKR